jgi:hypothetical protein
MWLAVGIGAAHRSSGGATTVDTGPDNISAFEICKQFVTDLLTAPAIAGGSGGDRSADGSANAGSKPSVIPGNS